MKLDVARSDVALSGLATADFQMGSSSKLFHVLSDLYEDRLRAWIREIITNAVDANRETGDPRPVEIRLPTYLDQSLTIRDYGPGLDRQRITIFTTLLASTKDQDDSQNGGWGLGCKSPFAYTDQFQVKTWPGDGTSYTWLMTRDPDGKLAFSLIHQEADSAPRGTEVQVPIDLAEDGEATRKWARLYAWFAGLDVTLDDCGTLETLPARPKASREFQISSVPDATILLMPAKGKRATHDELYSEEVPVFDTGTTLVLGDVPYYLPAQTHIPAIRQWDRLLSHATTLIYMPVGSLDLPPSRDRLQNSPRNQATLQALMEAIQADLAQQVLDSLDLSDLSAFTSSLQGIDHRLWPDTYTAKLANGIEVLTRRSNYYIAWRTTTAKAPSAFLATGYDKGTRGTNGHSFTKHREGYNQSAVRMRHPAPDTLFWENDYNTLDLPVVVLNDLERGAQSSIEQAAQLGSLSASVTSFIYLLRPTADVDRPRNSHWDKPDKAAWAQALSLPQERVILASEIQRIPRADSPTRGARQGSGILLIRPHRYRTWRTATIALEKATGYVRVKRGTQMPGTFDGDRTDFIQAGQSLLPDRFHWTPTYARPSLKLVAFVPWSVSDAALEKLTDAYALVLEHLKAQDPEAARWALAWQTLEQHLTMSTWTGSRAMSELLALDDDLAALSEKCSAKSPPDLAKYLKLFGLDKLADQAEKAKAAGVADAKRIMGRWPLAFTSIDRAKLRTAIFQCQAQILEALGGAEAVPLSEEGDAYSDDLL